MRAGSAAQLALAGLALVSAACSGGEAGDARHIRRFTPFTNEWARVSPEPTRAAKETMEIWEVSEFAPGTQATPEHRAAARRLIERCEQAVRKHGWEDYEKGRADGFEPLPKDGRHYYNTDYLFDDRVLDPERPEFLMYYDTPEGERLVGFMFYVATQADRGPRSRDRSACGTTTCTRDPSVRWAWGGDAGRPAGTAPWRETPCAGAASGGLARSAVRRCSTCGSSAIRRAPSARACTCLRST